MIDSPDHTTPRSFPQSAVRALGDRELRAALRQATTVFSNKRTEAVRALPEWEDLRTTANRIKHHTLERLDRYLEQFAANAELAGATIHWAMDAREACETIAGLIMPDAKIVKSKSMTTEEIELNGYLARGGYKPVETDLGEWIIQLAGEPPSHIIAPAIHKTKEQVAELFARELGSSVDHDITGLTAVARTALRQRFRQADVGITGVNFAIAETGAIVIIENEGNARLTTSVPRTHIAVMGMEKVIPRLCDLDTFLRILPRSGTGQALTTYQSVITGPQRDPAREGPDALHIIILDNGRSEMLANPVTREALACIRCGACLNICPVYRQVGGHAYGAVYGGPIGSVVTPHILGLEEAHHLPFASSLCGACRDVCPVKINIPRALVHLRKLAIQSPAETGVPGRREWRLASHAWSWTMMRAWRYRLFSRLGRFVQRTSMLQRLPGVRQWMTGRSAPRIAEKSFRELWPRTLKSELDQ